MRFEQHAIGDAMRTWLGRRRAEPVFTAGDDRLLELTDELFAYLRVHEGRAALIAYNGGTSTRLSLPGTWADVETGASAADVLMVPPGTSVWLGTPPPAPEAAQVEVNFAVTGAPTGEVRVAGSGPELGNWDPAKAPAADAVMLPAGGAFAYKLVVMGQDGPKWQPGDNNYLLVKEPATVSLRWAD